jgi:DNA-binding NarL/FixJ family response regulator
MQNKVRVAVFDDHPLMRAGIIHSLRNDPGLEVIAEGESAGEALQAAAKLKIDVMLLDVSMPGGGIDAARALKACYPNLKTIVLTVSEREDDVTAAIVAGVKGYVLKGIGASDLVRIVGAVARGETYVSPGLAQRLLVKMQQRWTAGTPSKDINAQLTVREEQILGQASLGLTNKEIARKLQLSEKTVKHYMTSVLQKLQARNRVEAIIAMKRRAAPEAIAS